MGDVYCISTEPRATVALFLILPKGGATSGVVDVRWNNTSRRTTSTMTARGPRGSHGGRARVPAAAFRVCIPDALDTGPSPPPPPPSLVRCAYASWQIYASLAPRWKISFEIKLYRQLTVKAVLVVAAAMEASERQAAQMTDGGERAYKVGASRRSAPRQASDGRSQRQTHTASSCAKTIDI